MLRRSDLSLSPIVTHVRRQELPLDEFIHLHLHQNVIPQTRAIRPGVGGGFLVAMSQGREPVCGQRGTDLGQPPPGVPRFVRAAELLVDLLYALVGQDCRRLTARPFFAVWLPRKSPPVVPKSPATSPLPLRLHERRQLSCPEPKGQGWQGSLCGRSLPRNG